MTHFGQASLALIPSVLISEIAAPRWEAAFRTFQLIETHEQIPLPAMLVGLMAEFGGSSSRTPISTFNGLTRGSVLGPQRCCTDVIRHSGKVLGGPT